MSCTVTSEEGVVTFTITRPQVRNAINEEVMNGLEQFLDRVESDPSAKWGVVTSEGGIAFCSGGDLGEFHALETQEEAYPMLSRMAGLLYRLAALPLPVVALMDGAAVGGGCELAAACDFRLMKTGTKAGFIQGTLAITTGWGGASLLYEKEKDHSRVLQLLMGARVHSAEELAAWGWITEVYPDEKQLALDRFFKTYESIEHTVLRSYKEIAVKKWEKTGLKERMYQEAKQCSVLWESDQHHAAVDRFRGKS